MLLDRKYVCTTVKPPRSKDKPLSSHRVCCELPQGMSPKIQSWPAAA